MCACESIFKVCRDVVIYSLDVMLKADLTTLASLATHLHPPSTFAHLCTYSHLKSLLHARYLIAVKELASDKKSKTLIISSVEIFAEYRFWISCMAACTSLAPASKVGAENVGCLVDVAVLCVLAVIVLAVVVLDILLFLVVVVGFTPSSLAARALFITFIA